MAAKEEPSGHKIISVNKKARFNYHIVETYEAGLVLTGPEIKSVRAGHISLGESYVRPERGDLYLINANITPYKFSADPDYDPIRKRKLLLHKHEIEKLTGRVEQKGLTIVPLQIYLKRGLAKLEIALAKGKDAPDKKKDMIDKDKKLEASRAMKFKKQG